MSWIVIARQCTTIWHTKARGRVIKSTVKCFQPFNTDAFLPQYPEQVVLAVPPDQHTPTFSVHTITKAIHKQRPNKTCISSSNLPKSTRPTVPWWATKAKILHMLAAWSAAAQSCKAWGLGSVHWVEVLPASAWVLDQYVLLLWAQHMATFEMSTWLKAALPTSTEQSTEPFHKRGILLRLQHTWQPYIPLTYNPPTPADSKGERVREERLWTTTNTTTGLGKLSKELEICVF